MSLRLRLLLAAGGVALVALLVADVATYTSLRSFLYGQVDASLRSTLVPSSPPPPGRPVRGGAAGAPPGSAGSVGGTLGPVRRLRSPSSAGGAFVEVRASDGTVLLEHRAHGPAGEAEPPPALPSDLPSATSGPVFFTAGSTVHGGSQFRVGVAAGSDGTTVIVALPLDATVTTLRQLVLIELLVTGTALVIAAALGWWLVRAALRPLSAMESTAASIAAGQLEARVPGEDARTEVGRLAGALNAMLARIREAFAARDATEAELRYSEERMRRFVADASHELRTPLAAVSAYSELFSLGADSRPEDLGRVMRGIEGESARMARLVEDLVLLARLDEGRPLERRAVDLAELADEAVRAAAVVGPAWPVSLEPGEQVETVGDRERLRQVLDNLLGNVRSHTPDGTPTVVRVVADGSDAVVEVADTGPGMEADDAARVFDRFFRPDSSRARRTGGAGLGLSIVAAIVDAHGGEVSVHTAPGSGATFRVRLPLAAGPGASGGPVGRAQ